MGIIVGLRWVVDRDRALKLTLAEWPACHTHVLPDGTAIRGAQGNLNFRVSIAGIIGRIANDVRDKQGRRMSPAEASYAS